MTQQQASKAIGTRLGAADGNWPPNGLHTLEGRLKDVTLYFEQGRF
jgi:hypothetical protein